MTKIDGTNVLITGGTGSLGQALVERLLSGSDGSPNRIVIFSRDELKQAQMKAMYQDESLDFQLGDVRNEKRIAEVLQGIDIVFHTAAMKRVEMCQRHVDEAILTNIIGTLNIVAGIRRQRLPVSTVLSVSSDKGVKPLNAYGQTKALQETVIKWGNLSYPETRFISVCYGNVMNSRGSVIPMFQEQIRHDAPVEVRNACMTRFFISLSQAVDALVMALDNAQPGEVYVPVLPSARIMDLATVLIGDRCIDIKITSKGHGEKIHETLITEEEAKTVVLRDGYYVVTGKEQTTPVLTGEYVSSKNVLSRQELKGLLAEHGFITDGVKV